mgnify:FL=1
MTRIPILICVATLVLVSFATIAIAADPPANQPNVLLIVADDLGWRDLSCEGSTFYETPNIDRLAARGMRFTQGYAACQVCSPSRAAIHTGKYPARVKITDYIGAPHGTAWKRNTKLLPAFYRNALPAEETTLAEVFRAAGYRTFFAGKWHLGSVGSHPDDHGFEINVGGFNRGSPPGGFFAPYNNPELTDGPPGEQLPLRLANETASFLENVGDQPFLACLSFYSVHAPIQSTEELWRKYRAKAAAMDPPNNRFIIDRTSLPVRQVQDHPVYAGMVESMDDAVGIVLDMLEAQGLAENTIVVFTSDNGGVSSGDGKATSNLPLRGGKGRQWEGGIREPYYVAWPAKIQPGTSDTPVSGIDLYPTLVDLAGLQVPESQRVDGVSLAPLLQGEEIADRPLIWHYPHYGNQGGEPSGILRRGEWKLIHYYEDGRNELYNVADDPGEQNDRAADEQQRTAAMWQELRAWLAETEAEMPSENPNFDAEKFAQDLERDKRTRIRNLERQHARFLNEDFVPNGGWWQQRGADGED